jgi:hypothetical protein
MKYSSIVNGSSLIAPDNLNYMGRSKNFMLITCQCRIDRLSSGGIVWDGCLLLFSSAPSSPNPKSHFGGIAGPMDIFVGGTRTVRGTTDGPMAGPIACGGMAGPIVFLRLVRDRSVLVLRGIIDIQNHRYI